MLRELARVRAAIVGEVQGASGVAAVRAAVLRLFEHFVFHEDVFATGEATEAGFVAHGDRERGVPPSSLQPVLQPGAVERFEGAVPVFHRVPLPAIDNGGNVMTHDRPHRRALSPQDACAELGEMVRAGTLEKRTVDAVLEAAGAAPLKVRQGHPAGLTDREVEVLRLVARGRTNREIAKALVITEKTAGHHVEHIYAKAGVSTRVGAALFAMQHGLVE